MVCCILFVLSAIPLPRRDKRAYSAPLAPFPCTLTLQRLLLTLSAFERVPVTALPRGLRSCLKGGRSSSMDTFPRHQHAPFKTSAYPRHWEWLPMNSLVSADDTS